MNIVVTLQDVRHDFDKFNRVQSEISPVFSIEILDEGG